MKILTSTAVLLAALANAGTVLPDAVTSIVFSGSSPGLQGSGNCNRTVSSILPTTASCTGLAEAFTDVLIGSATFHGQGSTTGETARASVDYTEVGSSPGGNPKVTTSLDYYVALVANVAPPVNLNTLRIPIDISIAGSVQGLTGAGSTVMGFANSNVHESGGGDVVGDLGDNVAQSAIAGNLDLSYNDTSTFIFGFDEGSPMVEVQLRADCEGGPQSGIGDLDFSCVAFADPTFTFNQAAFDQAMGAQTFPLADYFSFETSPGVTPDVGTVPEPGSLVLVPMPLIAIWLWKTSRRRDLAAL